jgi:hypothetical protein
MQIDDAAMAESAERCKHGEAAEWCGESECLAARKGLPVRVWRTQQGQVYHRNPTGEALISGQRLAERYGRGASASEKVALSLAIAELAGMAKTDTGATTREVRRLENAGILRSRAVGRTKLVRANKDAPFYRGLRDVQRISVRLCSWSDTPQLTLTLFPSVYKRC